VFTTIPKALRCVTYAHSVIGVIELGGANWAEVVTAIASAIAALGIAFAALGGWIAFGQLKESEKARQVALVTELARRWDEERFVKVRRSVRGVSPEDFRIRYEEGDKSNSQDFYDLKLLANFFEDFGSLVKAGFLDVGLVDTSIGSSVITYWEIWRLAVIEDRPRSDPRLYENWQYLYDVLRARAVARGDSSPPPRVTV
jgi:hypothetical protein